MKKVEPIIKLLTGIIEDRTVPRNIRAAAEEARKELTEKRLSLIGIENGKDEPKRTRISKRK